MRVLEYTVDGDFDGKKLYTFLKAGIHASARTVTKLRHSENGLKAIFPPRISTTLILCMRMRI